MLRVILLVVLGGFVTGCSGSGPTRAEVSGTVMLNGHPVTEGSINFFPVDGTTGPEAGGRIENGKFHIPKATGPVVGKHRVELRSFQKTGRKIQDPTAPPGTLTDEIANAFPPEFSGNSTLIREVKTSDNVFDFDVSTKKEK